MTNSPRRFLGVAPRVLVAFAALAAVGALGGCYERVVSSKGVGAEPAQGGYRSDTMLDRAYDDLTGSGDSSNSPKKPKPKVGGFRAR